MIGDAFFFLRMLVITMIVVVFAQVKIGQKSLEDHFQGWIESSVLVDTIQEAVDGGIALTKIGYKKIDIGLHGVFSRLHSHHGEKERHFQFTLKRSHTDESDEGKNELDSDSAKKLKAQSSSQNIE